MFKKGDRVWMQDHPQWGWAPAVVVSLSTNTNLRLITIKSTDNIERVVDSKSTLKISDEGNVDYSDMILIDNLNEGIMVHNLWKRYDNRSIYTCIGEVLVSVNPMQAVSGLYSDSVLDAAADLQYPHIYKTSAKAYKTLVRTRKPQIMLVSGESGSGKTESCKLVLQYLVKTSSSGSNKNVGTNKSQSIHNMILQSTPILESFGNAKTKRNANSSRFGKFFKIFFDDNGGMKGASITQFLLEKARVVQPPAGERNYSIFYSLVEGCDHASRRALGLNPGVHNYRLLSPSSFSSPPSAAPATTPAEQAADAKNFQTLVASFTSLGLASQLPFIFEVLAAILHLGNVEFEVHPHGGTAIVDNRPLQAASLLLLGPTAERQAMETALTTQLVSAGTNRKRGSVTRRLLEPHQAIQSRDALCKALYEALFDHICSSLNSVMSADKDEDSPPAEQGANSKSIGILDIFGFEIMDVNLFDQLLINYANEVLQLQFANQMITMEQQEYAKEKIAWSQVDFTINQPCVDLLEKKPKGILPMLEEECMLPQGGDKRLLQKLHDLHEKTPNYVKPRLASDSKFGITHFAGEVTYDVAGFVSQNRDDIHVDIIQLLLGSAKQNVASLGHRISQNKKSASGASISSKFRGALAGLLRDIGQAEANHLYYIRCIKPNPDKGSAKFDPIFAMHQMRSMGMLETIRVRKLGYALRLTFQQFLEQYQLVLGTVGTSNQGDPKTTCIQFLKTVLPPQSSNEWQMGITKIFLKEKLVGTLEEMRYNIEKKKLEKERLRLEEERKRREAEELKRKAEEERLRVEAEKLRAQEEQERKKREEERKRHEEDVRKKRELLQQEEIRLKEEIKRKEEKAKLESQRKKVGPQAPYLEAAKRGSLLLDTSQPSGNNGDDNLKTSQSSIVDATPSQILRESFQSHPSTPSSSSLHVSRPSTPSNLSRPSTPSNSISRQLPIKHQGTSSIHMSANNNNNNNSNNNKNSNININITNDSDKTTQINININITTTPSPKPQAIQNETLVGTLPELLSNTIFCSSFSEFLSTTPKDGLIELWQDIQSYKKMSERLLGNQSRLLFNKYFGHGNKFKVELDKKLLGDLKDRILYRNSDVSTFTKLELEVINLLGSQIPSFSTSGKAPPFTIQGEVNQQDTTKRVSGKGIGSPSQNTLLGRAAARVTSRWGKDSSSSSTPPSPQESRSAPSSSLNVAVSAVAKEPVLLSPREQAVLLFNENPKKGLESLVEGGFIENNAHEVASFFKNTPSIDKTRIGEYIGQRDPFNQEVLREFLSTFDFNTMEFDVALRTFLASFRLPGESQVIERIVETFAKQFCATNQDYPYIANSEAAFILSYSIIMLATDLHNPNVKTKMTKEQWLKNNTGCNKGTDFDVMWMKRIYDRIAKAPLSTTNVGNNSPSNTNAGRNKAPLQKAVSAQHISMTHSENKLNFPLLKRGVTKSTLN